MCDKRRVLIMATTVFFGLLLLIGGVYVFDRKLQNDGAVNWKPDGLKICLLEKPYGVCADQIRFSWQMNSSKNNIFQAKYHIVIASSMKNMKEENYIIDTGWCESGQNTNLTIEGADAALSNNALYYWKVELEDSQGEKSVFSDTQAFTTEIRDEWASTDAIWTENASEYAFLRTNFCVEQDEINRLSKAVLSVTAASTEDTKQYVYNLYLNGTYIGSGPARSTEKIIYDTYDVTEYLGRDNVMGAICYSESEQAFLCQLTLFYEDGSKSIILNSGKDKESWRVLDGNAAYGRNETVISTSYYIAHAENINAQEYPVNWLETDYDDSAWQSPAVSKTLDEDTLYPYSSENMQRYYITPETVIYKGDGHYFVDMGKEIVGGISVDVNCRSGLLGGKEPVEAVFRYGEELNGDGTVKYQMRTGNIYEENWTLNPGRNSYENIGMKTFRYIDIYSENISFTDKNIKGVAIRQPFDKEQSDFKSSSRLLNEIYEMTKYTVEATNQNLYVDSQSRERGAYEGDVLINMLASYAFSDHYSLARFSNEYVCKNRTWPAEYPVYAIMAAYWDYMYTGDTGSLEQYYELLKEKVDHITADDICGLIRNDYDEIGFNRPLVDWPETERDGYAYDEAEYNTVVNAAVCGGFLTMSKIAEALGETEDAEIYALKAEKLKMAMIRWLYVAQEEAFCDGLDCDRKQISHYAQHATAYPLYFQIYDTQEMKESMIRRIQRDGEIKTSVFSSLILLQGLYNGGAGDYATSLLLEENPERQHSWAYMMRHENATITAEAWSTEIKDNMTYSHPWGAAPASLIVQGIFGIKPTEAGFGEFDIKLQCGGLEEAEICLPTNKGEIAVSFHAASDGNIVSVNCRIPSNTEAHLMLPVGEGTDSLAVNGCKTAVQGEEYAELYLQSGVYKIEIAE